MAEEVAAVVGWEVVEDGADAVPESGNGSLGGSSQMRFDLCKRLLDRIEVGRVRRQEEQACACGFDHVADFVAFVGREIVHHYDVARHKRRHEALFQIGLEDRAVHRLVDHKGRGDCVVSQSSDEGCDLPMSVRDFADQPLSAPASAPGPGHVGAGAGLVDKDQLAWIKQLLRASPPLPRGRDVGPILLAGVNAFF